MELVAVAEWKGIFESMIFNLVSRDICSIKTVHVVCVEG